MKILLLSPEAHPFFKTGGLGDVAGALARELSARGHDVRLVLPCYRLVRANGFETRTMLREVLVNIDNVAVSGAVEQVDGPAPTWLIRCDRYFDRAGAYGEVVADQWRDYPDNVERFAFFCMAALWACKGAGWQPDIIHCNDWQTALTPVFVRNHPLLATDPFFLSARLIFSIHNLAFQGRASKSMLPRVGLGTDLFDMEGLEFYGFVNLMKGGLVYSDHITTVSKRYAEEIQTPELGCGLDGLLRGRADRLSGILNGIDDEEWNPAADPHLPASYTADDLSGKAVCKRELQRECGLAIDPATPLIGMVSRLSTQKGFELVDAVAPNLVAEGAQLVILGSGEPRYHRMLERMRSKFGPSVSIHLGFDNGLAHRIEAGADMFLMPSYYEPCGLNQMFSMRYGTPPIVRRTGGLADSVTNFTPSGLKSGRATGFVFGPYDPRDLWKSLQTAMDLYRRSPEDWRMLCRNGMARDFSWRTVAAHYEALYERALRSDPAAAR